MQIGPITAREYDDFLAFLEARVPGVAESRASGEKLDAQQGIERLWRKGTATAGDLAEAFSHFFDLPRLSFDEVKACPPIVRDLSPRYLRDAFVYPFEYSGQTSIAVADPTRSEVIDAVALALGERPRVHVMSFEDMELLFERASDQSDKPEVEAAAAPSLSVEGSTAETLQDLARGAPIVRQIDQLFERAIDVGATDIHLETERDQLRVRLRVDGYLRRDQSLPVAQAPAVISRIKILAGLDIAERRLPQDGRANLRIGSVEADLRIAIMPTIHGETAVIRILIKDSRLLAFSRIGMTEPDQKAFKALLAEPHGVVIVTGPTGSGKTTTLATAISTLNDPARKIVTVEDPIEYQIAGVHQTQIKPMIGLTFATALRSFLRHDPDVIMVGEMRDRETAGVGVQAALTGHLVLTTLHTNSAADAAIRLADMGVEPYLISASLRGVLAQRLVRRLCQRCLAVDPASAETASAIAEARHIELAPDAKFCGPVGCEACGQTGYRGRIGIFEVMRIDEAVQSLIRAQADKPDIVRAARAGGMTLMMEDGLRKCAEGLTSIEEILRATG